MVGQHIFLDTAIVSRHRLLRWHFLLMQKLSKRIITSETDFDALAPAWRALENQVPQLLPFQSFDWNRSWWTIFADASVFHRDELLICALYDDQQLVAVMPLTNTHVGLHTLFLYRYVRPFGADPNLTELRVPLALPEYTETILQQWEDLSKQETFGLTEFQLIHTKEHADHFLANNHAVSPLSERSMPNFVLHLEGDWPSFKSNLKRNIKESLRRCYNSLKRDNLQARLKVLRGRAEILPELADFYRLHSARASAMQTVAHPDYFANPRHRAFLEALLASDFGERMALFCLELDGRIVAVRIGFLMGEELYLYYSGYELEFGKYSVMTTLLAEIAQWAFTQSIRRLNLSVGDDVSKTRWGPEKCDYVEYQCVKNSVWRKKIGQSIFKLRQYRKDLFCQVRNQCRDKE